MMGITIAAANVDLVMAIVAVVGWIIAQSLNRKQKPPNRPPPVPPPAGQGEPISPNEELRRFFEGLERGLTSRMETAETPGGGIPPPLPSRPARRGAKSVTLSSVEPVAAPSMSEPAVTPHTVPASLPLAPHLKWTQGFGQRDHLRQMIVAAEVLGAPLALRRPGMMPAIPTVSAERNR